MEALAAVEDRKLAIVLAGQQYGRWSRLAADAQRLGVAGRVRHIGQVEPATLAALYRSAALTVIPSLHEGFGFPALEAMACGCPVVTSDLSSMPEVAGGAALLVDPHRPESIAAAMVEACGPQSEHLRERGLSRAGEFNWAATAEATLNVYREVARRRTERRLR